jgi:hypothetical protein
VIDLLMLKGMSFQKFTYDSQFFLSFLLDQRELSGPHNVLCTVFYEEAKPAMYFKRIA